MIAVSRIPCAVCYLELAQCLVDAGYGTHLGCDPHETPDPKAVAAQGVAVGLTGRLRGQETARRERELSTGPDRPSRASERNG